MFDENNISESDIEAMEAEGGKFVAELAFEEKTDPEPGIRNDLHKPKTHVVKPVKASTVLTEQEKWRIAIQNQKIGLEAMEGMKKFADRAARYVKVNSKSLDPQQQKRFKKEFMTHFEKETKEMALIRTLEGTHAYSWRTGFTLTVMALAVKELPKYSNMTLPEIKKIIKTWRYLANKKHKARVHPTRREGIIRYHILKNKEDGDSQCKDLQEFEDKIDVAKEDRKELTATIVKEAEEAKAKQIVIEATGESVIDETTEATDNDAINTDEEGISEEGDQ